MEPKKWWLISDEALTEARTTFQEIVLNPTHQDVDDWARDALHAIDTGTGKTNAVPDDLRDPILPDEKPDGSTESRLTGVF